jgi:hypothetical protein
VGVGASDIAATANTLAIAAAHFVEARGLSQGDGIEENLRSRLRDVADTAKHGSLRQSDRTVALAVSLAYEFDDVGRTRFLRTEVTATNNRFGSFDLIETLGRYIRALHDRFNLQFQSIDPQVEPQQFGTEAVAHVTANTAEVGSVNVRTYTRDASGTLVLADAPRILFVVR